ncbi:MAG: hypothetical protein QNJ44_21240 [Rhodobacter sp.]|nr:hypothetical protein [Rhodobacter sp.]
MSRTPLAALVFVLGLAPGWAQGSCETGIETTATGHLLFDLSAGLDATGQPRALHCDTAADTTPYGVRRAAMVTPNGSVLGVGKGGQIYSLKTPGDRTEIITGQRWSSIWADEVFQTIATSTKIRQVQQPGVDTRYHYHQAGTYTRGPFRGDGSAAAKGCPPVPGDAGSICPGPFFSPAVHNALVRDAAGQVIGFETMTLTQMAHVDRTYEYDPGNGSVSDLWRPDRFPVFFRIVHLGDDVFELTYIWFNHSKFRNDRSDDGEMRGAFEVLDRFNFPWAPFNGEVLRSAFIGLNGRTTELIDDLFPGTWTLDENVSWGGGFTDTAPDAPGFAFTVPDDGAGNRYLRHIFTAHCLARKANALLGRCTDGGVQRDEDIQYSYFLSNIVAGSPGQNEIALVHPGEALQARFYLMLGPRSGIEASISRFGLVEASTVSGWQEGQSGFRAQDVVFGCFPDRPGGARMRMLEDGGACRETETPAGLYRRACIDCLPVYELANGRGGYFYSTDPYPADPALACAPDPEARHPQVAHVHPGYRCGVLRIVGWAIGETHAAAGARAVSLCNPRQKAVGGHCAPGMPNAGDYSNFDDSYYVLTR